MKNIIHIADNKIQTIETVPGNGIQLVFDDVESGQGVELYEGDQYSDTLEMDGNSTEIHANYMTGSILHFRIINTDDTPGDFLHIIYKKDGLETFYKSNEVVVINKYQE